MIMPPRQNLSDGLPAANVQTDPETIIARLYNVIVVMPPPIARNEAPKYTERMLLLLAKPLDQSCQGALHMLHLGKPSKLAGVFQTNAQAGSHANALAPVLVMLLILLMLPELWCIRRVDCISPVVPILTTITMYLARVVFDNVQSTAPGF